ncbi:hypothetical protein [Agrobacterium pusense]|jgi:hypothetical protein|uniref:hypothetical protein n=1 Tax=Agrobacterium pusense TaxID=648995 RepID=UPI00245351AE|nr:hypothetical protein [Agrobacterium pusense]
MPKSYKPAVIQRIFDVLTDPKTGELSRTVVYSSDIQDAKRYCNETFGSNIKLDSNPYNFMKDLVRGQGAIKMWPEGVRQRGWTGEQRTGGGAVFEFVPLCESQPDKLDLDFKPRSSTPEYEVQSLSLAMAAKALGRNDESWLLQVCVNLRIIETHLAVGDDQQFQMDEVSHLQMDIKLRKVQIDALFLATLVAVPTLNTSHALVTVEAKQGNQRILSEQIARQVVAAFAGSDINIVIPIAVAALRGKGVYVAEFKAIHRDELSSFTHPELHRDAIFKLMPPVKGISSIK